jgi:hypothetical protein
VGFYLLILVGVAAFFLLRRKRESSVASLKEDSSNDVKLDSPVEPKKVSTYRSPIEIRNNKELQHQNSVCEESDTMIIRGSEITEFRNIIALNCSICLVDSELQDFGELSVINGGFSISPDSPPKNLVTLKNLVVVKGNLRISHSNISDLGQLEEVTGDLNLRDTPVTNIGKLRKVGGNLLLPKQLKEQVDLSGIDIKGKVRYYKSSKTQKQQAEEKYEGQDIWSFSALVEKQEKSKKSLLTADVAITLGGISCLTDFGKENIERFKNQIEKTIREEEQTNGGSLLAMFLKTGRPYTINENKIERVDYEHYRDYFIYEKDFNHYKKLDDIPSMNTLPISWSHVMNNAFLNYLRTLLRESEDSYRESIGMPKIGEGWLNETNLFYLLCESFNTEEIVQHYSPKWLGRQHLDIYFPKHNIGVEYQGIQHYEAVDFFGGEEGLKKTKERDKKKKLLCKENDCRLFIVDEGYDYSEVERQIKKALVNG